VTTPSLSSILETISDRYGVPGDVIQGRSRPEIVVEARHAFCYLATMRGYTQEGIGAFINRDHTTISMAIRSFRDRIDCDVKARGVFARAEEGLKEVEALVVSA